MMEMTAIDYFKVKKRYLESIRENEYYCDGGHCSKCMLSSQNNGRDIYCPEYEMTYTQEAVEKMCKWAEEHPEQTYLTHFMRNYPNCGTKIDCCRNNCVANIFGEGERPSECGSAKCKYCWSRPYDVDEKNE